MSAEELREAATLMRARAEAATPGPWSLTYVSEDAVPSQHTVDRHYVMGCFDGNPKNPTGPAAMCEFPADAEHIAGMEPAVALAVADLLDEVAKKWDAVSGGTRPVFADEVAALAVARAYLGRSE